MSETIQPQLREFAKRLLERRGALVEWSEGADEGWAMPPAEFIAAFGGAELFRLAYRPTDGGWCVDLASDFLDRAEQLLEIEPRTGLLQIPELYLKKADMVEPVARAFTWQNARVTIKSTQAARVEYHVWSIAAELSSEDRWEELSTITINSASGAEVALPEHPLTMTQPVSYEPQDSPIPDTLYAALRRAAACVESRAAAFVTRLETRLSRDRRRLRDYYGALLKEEKKSAGEEPQAKKRAVELELRRKLTELEERYVVRAKLTPLVLVRLQLPVLAVTCEVLRRQAKRSHMLYWNPLLKELEPMCCSVCGAGSFSLTFTDADVQPLCAACVK
jgi:hypothetical protein